MVSLLRQIYQKAQSAEGIGNEYGDWFHTDVETRQGDPLSPLLFIANVDRAMDFADDIDLIDADFGSLRRQIGLTKEHAEQAGLLLNTNKTICMVFGNRKPDDSIRLAGETIEKGREIRISR